MNQLFELRFLVRCVLPAPVAILLQLDLRLDFLLVALRKIVDVLAHRAGKSDEVIL